MREGIFNFEAEEGKGGWRKLRHEFRTFSGLSLLNITVLDKLHVCAGGKYSCIGQMGPEYSTVKVWKQKTTWNT
jgi:hypothetical protein